MEKKGNFFILLIIVAVLTLIIAVLAAFIVIVGINSPQQAAAPGAAAQADSVQLAPPPDEASLATMALFSDRQFFNLKNSGSSTLSVCIVDVSIKYFSKVDGIKDVAAKLTLNQNNLKEIVSSYFQELTRDEIEQISTKAAAKDDLKKELNEYLISTISNDGDRKKVSEIIYEVVFSGWNYQ